jgi:hypothetical protein
VLSSFRDGGEDKTAHAPLGPMSEYECPELGVVVAVVRTAESVGFEMSPLP